ncbi:MAG: hypothetical protein Q8O14_08045 [bacterium]|jgi:hypothetical protein|nr:hypothetical protein [bacterium]
MKHGSDSLGRTLIAGALAVLLQAGASRGQTLEETLNDLSADAAAQYVAPISSALGANLNSGWFHRAPKADKLGFNLEAGVALMGSFFPTDASHFDVQGQFRFSNGQAGQLVDEYERTEGYLPASVRNELVRQLTGQNSTVRISGATVIGAPTDSVTVAFGGDTYTAFGNPYTLPAYDLKLPFGGFGGLADISLLPFVAPQLTLGTFYGTQFTLRYLPAVELDSDLGEFKYLGFGIQHNPAVWLDMKLPVDVAASLFTQSIQVGDIFDCSSFALGLNASKTFGWRFLNLTPYAGLMYEDASMKVSYDFIVEVPTDVDPAGQVVQPVSLDLASDNTMRLTLGTNIRLGIINWNLDYSIATYSAVSMGVSLAF